MTMKVQQGFSLLELMIVVVILGVLVMIAIPNYQEYIRRTKRVEMMNELQNMAKVIEARKLAAGRMGYAGVDTASLHGAYPKSGSGSPSYDLTINFENNDKKLGKWTMVATPKTTSTQAKDGILTLRYDGYKCRRKSASKCGFSDEWRNN